MSPTKGTPTHSVRVDPDLWAKVGEKLDQQTTPAEVTFTVNPDDDRSDIMRGALQAYVADE